MKRIIVLSGAGMSAESGIQTFRGMGGLWNDHKVEDVASPEAWNANPELVMDFYNQRRKQLLEVVPNKGHFALAELESHYNVTVVTQNVDDLHERAGSTDVLHLHGELTKARSMLDANLVYDIDGWELKFSDNCELGSQLRPHIVWFGEEVPMMDTAAEICNEADLFIVVGTSLNVYPAASLIHSVPSGIEKYLIDPSIPSQHNFEGYTCMARAAGEGLPELVAKLLQ